MDSYGIEEARNILGDLIDRVRLGGEHIALTRYGKPAVVLVSQEWFNEAEELAWNLIPEGSPRHASQGPR
jgi:prevent-host-death family protein